IAVTSSAFDTFVYLLQPGTIVAANDDSGGTLNSRLPADSGFMSVGSTSDYTIEVTSSSGGATGAYTLTIIPVPLGSFVTSGQVALSGQPLPGVTMAFTDGLGAVIAPPVMTDAAGRVLQTFTQAPCSSVSCVSPIG